jgi:hypothetical protein
MLNPYRPVPIGGLDLGNSPRLRDLLQGGRLRLSFSEALAAAIEKPARALP